MRHRLEKLAVEQPNAKRLERKADRTDDVCSLGRERVAQGHGKTIELVFFGAVAHWTKQFRIDAGYLGEHARVELVAFAVVLIDSPQRAGVGHEAVAAVGFHQAADPWTVSRYFNGEQSAAMLPGQASLLFDDSPLARMSPLSSVMRTWCSCLRGRRR